MNCAKRVKLDSDPNDQSEAPGNEAQGKSEEPKEIESDQLESGTPGTIINENETTTIKEAEPASKDIAEKDSDNEIDTNIGDEKKPNRNPDADECEVGDLMEQARDDAIGDTMYSKRYVLSTIYKIVNEEEDLSGDEEFEKEMCLLWDMTYDSSVVKLLMENDVLDLFGRRISVSTDFRFVEIIIGIIGNMCIESVCKDIENNKTIFTIFMSVIESYDPPTLIQVMRGIKAMTYYAKSEDNAELFNFICQYECFEPSFCYILSNSLNKTLLIDTLEALNGLLNYFILLKPKTDDDAQLKMDFCDFFVKESYVKSTIDAFNIIMKKREEEKALLETDIDSNQENIIDKDYRLTMQMFVDLHYSLTSHCADPLVCYTSHLDELVTCLTSILETYSKTEYFLSAPLSELNIIDGVNKIIWALGDPTDENCLSRMIAIWKLVSKEIENHAAEEEKTKSSSDTSSKMNGFEDDEPNPIVSYNELCPTALDFISRSILNATNEQLQHVFAQHASETIWKLLDVLGAAKSKDDNKECCRKIKEAFEDVQEVAEAK